MSFRQFQVAEANPPSREQLQKLLKTALLTYKTSLIEMKIYWTNKNKELTNKNAELNAELKKTYDTQVNLKTKLSHCTHWIK